jgi:hypothetical protein
MNSRLEIRARAEAKGPISSLNEAWLHTLDRHVVNFLLSEVILPLMRNCFVAAKPFNSRRRAHRRTISASATPESIWRYCWNPIGNGPHRVERQTGNVLTPRWAWRNSHEEAG